MDSKEMKERLKARRKVFLTGKIEEKPVNDLASELVELNLVSETEQIELIIDSGGGVTPAALKLYDVMKSLKAPVRGVVIGECSSAAIAVYLACNSRAATKHSRFVVHQCWFRIETNLDAYAEEKVLTMLANSQRNAESYRAILAKETGLKPEEVDKLMNDGENLKTIIPVDRAKDLGIVQEVLETYSMV
jgi:ATP-dependent Clp protease protease subunit